MKSRSVPKVVSADGLMSDENTGFREAPPAFNNFNFTDFMGESQESNHSMPSQSFTNQEARVMKLTHLKYDDSSRKNSKNKDKSIRMRNLSGHKSSTKVPADNLATADSLSGSSFRVVPSSQRKSR